MANLTTSNLRNITKEMNSSTEHRFRAAILIVNIIMNSFACPLTIGLNVLVIAAIKRRRSLQSNANIMLACLAVTDVLTGLNVQPANIIWNTYLLVGTENHFAEVVKFQRFFVPWLGLSSCLHLMAVVWERLYAIKFSYRYPHVLTKRNIKLAILFCWIYSGLCQTGMHLMGTRSTLSIILGSHVSIGCVFFVSSSYAVLYSETRRHQRMIKAQYLSQEVVEKFLKDNKALKTTVLVVVAVGLCYLPVSFYLVFTNYEKRLYLVREMTFSLVSFNSLLNPLIYCWRQREIRKLIFRPFSHVVHPFN